MNTNLAFLASASLSLVSVSAFGLPVYLKNLNDFYGENGIDVSPISNTYKCATCHNSASGGSRNVFGQDVGKSIRDGNGFSGMEFLDSDSDSFTNLEELFAGTAPALNSEKPEGKINVSFSATQGENGGFLISGQTEKCTDFTIKSFGIKVTIPGTTGFVDSGVADVSGIDNLILPLETKDSKGTLLVKCITEKKAGSLQIK
jgi:hypothetical protein